MRKQSDKMAWGMTLLVTGLLILLEKVGVTRLLPFSKFLQSTGTYFLAAGIIFLIYKKEKTLGIIFTGVGVFMHFDLFFGWMHSLRAYMFPMVLLLIGVILIFSHKRGR